MRLLFLWCICNSHTPPQHIFFRSNSFCLNTHTHTHTHTDTHALTHSPSPPISPSLSPPSALLLHPLLFCCLILGFSFYPLFPQCDPPATTIIPFFKSPLPLFSILHPSSISFHIHPIISLSFPLFHSQQNHTDVLSPSLLSAHSLSLIQNSKTTLSPLLSSLFFLCSLFPFPCGPPPPFSCFPLPPSSLSLAGSVSQRRDSRKERKGGKGRTRVRVQEWGRLGRGVWGLSPRSWGVGGVEIHPNILF